MQTIIERTFIHFSSFTKFLMIDYVNLYPAFYSLQCYMTYLHNAAGSAGAPVTALFFLTNLIVAAAAVPVVCTVHVN